MSKFKEDVLQQLNLEKAAQMFRKAANKGYAISQYEFARCCEGGEGVEKDLKKATEFYQLAANQAQCSLEHCYEVVAGIEIEKELKETEETAESQGLTDDEHYNRGRYYLNESGGGWENLRKAVYHYTLAAKQGHIEALGELAYCYEEGLGVRQDSQKSKVFCALASRRALVRVQLKRCKTKDDGDNLPEPELAFRRAAAAGLEAVTHTLAENVKNLKINEAGPSGRTALHFSAIYNRKNVASQLIAMGAQETPDALNKRPSDYANESGNDELKKLFKKGA